jgi:hypothetical protein
MVTMPIQGAIGSGRSKGIRSRTTKEGLLCLPRGSVENRPTGVTSKPANGVAQDVILIYPAFS